MNAGWILGVAALLLVGFILDREIYFYEGTHLRPRVQAWLYDRWAKKYDAGKRESQLRDSPESKLEVYSIIRTMHSVKLVLIVVAVALSSCRAVVDTRVEKNGSGELRTSIVFSAEEKQNFDGAPGNAGKNICDNLKGNAPPETVFMEEVKGDETYCTTLHSFHTLKQLRDLYEGMVNVTVNDLRMVLGNFVFNIQVDLTSEENEAAPSEWRLTLPGEIGHNNADRIENNTLVWNIEPGEVRTLEAESAVGPGLLTQTVIGGLIVLVGIVFAVRLARNFAKRNEIRYEPTP